MLYKYISQAGAEAFLRRPSLKFSNPFCFNDPLEFCYVIAGNLKSWDQLKEAFASIGEPVSPADEEEALKAFKMLGPICQMFDLRRDEGLNRLGVLCLSSAPDVHLMWSHYASGFYGVCVGVNTSNSVYLSQSKSVGQLFMDGSSAFFPVTYVKERVEVAMINDSRDWFEKVARSKLSMWSYEREHRAFLYMEENALVEVEGIKRGFYTLLDIPDDAVGQIILGVGFLVESRDEVFDLLLTKFGDRLAVAGPSITDSSLTISELSKETIRLLRENFQNRPGLPQTGEWARSRPGTHRLAHN